MQACDGPFKTEDLYDASPKMAAVKLAPLNVTSQVQGEDIHESQSPTGPGDLAKMAGNPEDTIQKDDDVNQSKSSDHVTTATARSAAPFEEDDYPDSNHLTESIKALRVQKVSIPTLILLLYLLTTLQKEVLQAFDGLFDTEEDLYDASPKIAYAEPAHLGFFTPLLEDKYFDSKNSENIQMKQVARKHSWC